MREDLKLVIAQAKAKYGEVFAAEVEDDLYLFRLLTRREYKEILMVAETEDMIQEIVCQIAVIFPEGLNFATGDAGLPQLIAPHIIYESGFGNKEKTRMYFNQHRELMGSFEAQAEATIQSAFPHITEDEMEDWSVNKFIKTVVKAEWLLKNIHGYPISFINDEELGVEGEEVEETEPPTFKELGNEMRQQGLDPMVEYAPYILQPRPFAESPFIGGTEYWKKVF